MMDKAILNINSFTAIFELSIEWTFDGELENKFF